MMLMQFPRPVRWLLCSCMFGHAAVAVALPESQLERLGGRLEAQVQGTRYVLPTLSTDIEADVRGDLVTVTVRQRFENPFDEPMHASYLFPLNKDAAVFEMILEVGDERLRAQIDRVQQAVKTFEAAKDSGKSAALLRQHRPNMFTQDVANLLPGIPIDVTLRYVQSVPKVDGAYELVLPLVTGPRFEGGATTTTRTGTSADSGLDDFEPDTPTASAPLPAYPPVAGLSLPGELDAERVSIAVSLRAGVPIQAAESRTHALDIVELGAESWSLQLEQGRVIDNRDFVLRYDLAGEATSAAALSQFDDRGGFFSVLIEPPQAPAEADIMPREVVFVLDASGSMAGLPMDASKAFMRAALRSLRPSDTFRIIRFSDEATEFSRAPLPVTQDNIRRGMRYTAELNGSGGTVMTSGIEQALDVAVPTGSVRLVVFLTDGYIGAEDEVLGLIHQRIGAARLYAYGVGTGINRFLLAEMARVGRGFARFMDPTEDIDAVAAELVARIDAPLLTDIELDLGDLDAEWVYPQRIPDLFAGDSVRIVGRVQVPGRYDIVVRGDANGHSASMPLQLDIKQGARADGGQALPLTWARSAIADSMRALRQLPANSEEADVLREHVTGLGLDFSLVTRWTAFVAVSEQIYNPTPELTDTHSVPLPQVAGVSRKAYGLSGSPGGSLVVASGPEPQTIFGLMLLGVAGALVGALRRRRV